jgi:hypothetical protein
MYRQLGPSPRSGFSASIFPLGNYPLYRVEYIQRGETISDFFLGAQAHSNYQPLQLFHYIKGNKQLFASNIYIYWPSTFWWLFKRRTDEGVSIFEPISRKKMGFKMDLRVYACIMHIILYLQREPVCTANRFQLV